VQQFGELSHNLKAIVLIDANTGWAVGEPHWDQNTLQYKGTIIKTTNGGTSWTDQEAGVAETLQGVSFSDSNRGWVVGNNGVILHTTDGGAHWTTQTVATTDDFTNVFFTDANNGWATCNRPVQYDVSEDDFVDWQGSIWHTVDGGQTWAQQTMPATTSLLTRVDFVDSKTGWAAGLKLTGYPGYSDGFNIAVLLGVIYGTTNGGATWTELFTTSQGLTFTALHFVDAMNGWAAGFPHSSDWTGGCTFHTTDGGKTWQVQDAGDFDEQVRDLHFLDGNRGYAVGTADGGAVVWRTLDGGATWTFIRMPEWNPLTDEGLWAVAATGNFVLALGDRDLQAQSTHPWDSCGTLATCGSDCECLFTESYINPHYMFLHVFFVDQTHGWVSGSRTFSVSNWGLVILATQDGGKTWTTQYERAPPTDSLFSVDRLNGIYFTDASNGWAVGSSDTYLVGNDYEHHSAIMHTVDGGQHWTEQGAELYTGYDLEFFGVQFLNGQEGWAVADDNYPSYNVSLAHTTNGGSLWSWVDTGIQGAPLGIGFATPEGSVSARDPQHVWAVGDRPKAVYTTDGGGHWMDAKFSCGNPECGMRCYAVAMTDGQNGWIAGGDYPGPGVTLYQTTDGGADWLRHTLPEERAGDLRDIQFIDATHGWAAGETGNLLSTSDAGATWTYVDTGTGADLLGLRFLDAQHGWVAGDYGSILSYASDRIPAGQPAIQSAVNSAGFVPEIAPATWISVFGANLSTSTRSWKGADFNGNKLPTQLDGVGVNVNGKPAFVSYISPSQVNVLVPDDTAAGPVPVEVVTSQGRSSPLAVQESQYSPSLFRLPVEGGVYVVAQTTDGMLVGNFEVGYALGIPTQVRPAQPGEIVTLYGTGFGPTSPALPTDSLVSQPAVLATPVTFLFGRTLADVVWSGLTASGLYQFNIRIPNVPSGDQVIVAEINGYRSQSDSVVSVQQ
jgi:uncharacterized protein (TIGR03437 family)